MTAERMRSRKYLLLSMLSMGSALLFAFIFLVGHRWYAYRESMRDELAVQASLIGANASAALVFSDARTADEIVGTATRVPQMLEVALYRENGRLLARFARDGETPHFGENAPEFGHSFTPSDLRLVAPIEVGGNAVGRVALRVGMDGLHRELARFIAGLLVIASVSVLLGHLASRQLRRRMAAAERELHQLALLDRVTGLENRHAFERALAQTARRHERDGGGSALLFIDVDGFKKVNDMFGHQTGDRLLALIGARLREALRVSDVVARIGGDEFGVILVNTSVPDDAARVAESLIRLAAEPFKVADAAAHVGFSIGIAMIPQDGGGSVEDLVRHADLAMYHAKQRGKGNHQFFSAALGDSVRRRLDIEADLRIALQEGGLHLAYQPQAAAAGGSIQGLEALLRWRHATRGAVSPAEFIPVAEESGLIMDIGRFVVDSVCRDIAALRGRGLRMPTVAINVSARQFVQGDLAAELSAALRHHGLDPADVEIELTESVLMDRLGRGSLLADLAESGFRIAIDDFGTGYSSLSYLKRLPVDKLKIDMSFVRDLPDNAESVAIVGGVVVMAHAIGLRVVAEGVETPAQAECLTACGCDLLQGYLIGYPQDLETLVPLFAPA